MSSRRSTRATSKAASNRASSPPISENDIPGTPSTKRPIRRGAGTSTVAALPPVANRPSTAYGTNATPLPSTIRPSMGFELESVLENIQNPAGPSRVSNYRTDDRDATPRPGPGRGRGRGTPAPMQAEFVSSSPPDEPTMSVEDAIYAGATINSSPSSVPSNIPRGVPALRTPAVHATFSQQTEEQSIHKIVRENPIPRQRPVAPSNYGTWIRPCISYGRRIVNHTIPRLWRRLNNFGKGPFSALVGLLFILLTYSLICRAIKPSDTLPDASNSGIFTNMGRFVPTWSTPKNYFSPSDYSFLDGRIKGTERDIKEIRKEMKGLHEVDANTVAKLEQILPYTIVVKKDKQGKLIIQDDFWHALRSKIRSDNSLLQKKIDTVTGISESDVRSIAASETREILRGNEARGVWDQWLESNRRKTGQWQADSQKAPTKSGKSSWSTDEVISRDEFLEKLKENYRNIQSIQQVSQRDTEQKITELTKRFETSLEKMAKLEADHIPRAQLKSIVSHYVKDFAADLQLERVSSANIKITGRRDQHVVNHLSDKTGAVINPSLTSYDFLFPSMNRWRATKWGFKIWGLPIKDPKPPSAALQPWEEFGDCWCSPQQVGKRGLSLAFVLGNYIFPKTVVVEHISASGSVEPGSTPKDMELWARIQGPADDKERQLFQRIEAASNETLTPVDDAFGNGFPPGWVRIGTWTYDAESSQEVQSFPIQIDLGMWEHAQTNEVLIRSKNNWGGGKVEYTCLYRVRLSGDIYKPNIPML